LADYKAKEDQTMALFRKMAEEQRQRGGLWNTALVRIVNVLA
jgi:hypothetical protein